jgi:hypothetical protein
LFTADAIDDLLQAYAAVIEQLLRQPDLRVSEFQLDVAGVSRGHAAQAMLSVLEELSEDETQIIIGEAAGDAPH